MSKNTVNTNTLTPPPESDIIAFAEKITGYKLTDVQQNFLKEVAKNHRQNIVLAAPRGSGKTMIMSIISAWYLTHAKNYAITIAAGSREQAFRMMSWLHMFFSGPLRKYIKLKKHAARYSIYIAELNNRVNLVATSKPGRRGERANLLIIDEAESIEEEIILDYLGIATLDPNRVIIVSTPDWTRAFSFFRQVFKEGEQYNYKVFRWTSEDAKKIPGWITAYEREKLRAQDHVAWFKTQWEAEFAVEEGLVFKNLEACITKEKPVPVERHPIRIGIDWGYKHNTVIIVAQLVGRVVNILRVYGYQNVTFSAVTRYLLAIYAEFEKYTSDIAIISDASAMGAEKTAELRSYGLNVIGVPFVNEKISHLIPNAISWVENAALRIYEGETKLLQQLASYYWEVSEAGKLKTKKASDDYVDALLLALRDWRYVNLLPELEETESSSTPVSIYNYPETERFIRLLRGED